MNNECCYRRSFSWNHPESLRREADDGNADKYHWSKTHSSRRDRLEREAALEYQVYGLMRTWLTLRTRWISKVRFTCWGWFLLLPSGCCYYPFRVRVGLSDSWPWWWPRNTPDGLMERLPLSFTSFLMLYWICTVHNEKCFFIHSEIPTGFQHIAKDKLGNL